MATTAAGAPSRINGGQVQELWRFSKSEQSRTIVTTLSLLSSWVDTQPRTLKKRRGTCSSLCGHSCQLSLCQQFKPFLTLIFFKWLTYRQIVLFHRSRHFHDQQNLLYSMLLSSSISALAPQNGWLPSKMACCDVIHNTSIEQPLKKTQWKS